MRINKKLWLFVPPVMVLALMAVFYVGLKREQTGLPSPHIGKELPEFSLPSLGGGELTRSDAVTGEAILINFFASWCVPCLAEHPVLESLRHDAQIPIVGIVWNDTEHNIVKWLTDNGNIYSAVGFDPDQEFALALGVYGIPETFVVDGEGIIRFRWTGALTPELVESTLLPELKKWQ